MQVPSSNMKCMRLIQLEVVFVYLLQLICLFILVFIAIHLSSVTEHQTVLKPKTNNPPPIITETYENIKTN